jgi:hypothetical protein
MTLISLILLSGTGTTVEQQTGHRPMAASMGTDREFFRWLDSWDQLAKIIEKIRKHERDVQN